MTDPAAVEAAKRMTECIVLNGSAYLCFVEHRAAAIITDCYAPRLTAERQVREKLVTLVRAIPVTHLGLRFRIADVLAEAEKLT